MATFLLELFSEEIPSRMQQNAAEQLSRLITTALQKAGLPFGEVKSFVSPRHLALQVAGLPLVQPDTREEKRGPKIGAPEQALKGFLSSTGVTVEQCEQRDGYYYATIEKKGGATADTLKKIIEETLLAFAWPKSMHWGSRETRPLAWVRPLHRMVALLDDAVVSVQFAHLTASNITEGHRFMAPAPIAIAHAEKYEELLKEAFVVVDFEKRKNYIGNAVHNLAVQNGLQVVDDNALLDEVTGLVEHAVPLLCQFDKKFLELPPEVLISEMKNHQRYFALRDHSGALANQFITVANMVNADGGAKVKAGNTRVVRARLADGEFYWEQDRKTSLEDWGKKLSDVVFHAKVGMMDAKVARIEALAVEIAKAIGFTDIASVQKAAQLCKADLTSGMVGEFPELQGIMGRYYALAQGESAEIADAIRDHYKPLGAGDSVPEPPLAAIIAIADKLDSITSLFAAGEKPTGSKDPLALRRAALGVLRILLQHDWNIDLVNLARHPGFALGQIPGSPTKFSSTLREIPGQARDDRSNEIVDFFAERLKQILRDENTPAQVIEASITHRKSFIPVAIVACTKTLAVWLETDSGKTTLAAIKRASNILAAEEKKHKTTYAYDAVKLSALVEPSEKMLQQTLQQFTPNTPQDLEMLAAPIQAFFTDVMVNAEDAALREARLALLAGVRAAAQNISDFSEIEG